MPDEGTPLKTATRIRDRIEASRPPRELADDAAAVAQERAEVARARAEELAATARDQAEVARARATEVAEQARERAADAADTVRPFLDRILAFLASLIPMVTEQGREVASRVGAPKRVRRRRRLEAAGWFAGGFAVGAAAGWVLHARLREEAQHPDYLYGEGSELGADADSPYGREAEAIDAHRENAPFR